VPESRSALSYSPSELRMPAFHKPLKVSSLWGLLLLLAMRRGKNKFPGR